MDDSYEFVKIHDTTKALYKIVVMGSLIPTGDSDPKKGALNEEMKSAMDKCGLVMAILCWDLPAWKHTY